MNLHQPLSSGHRMDNKLVAACTCGASYTGDSLAEVHAKLANHINAFASLHEISRQGWDHASGRGEPRYYRIYCTCGWNEAFQGEHVEDRAASVFELHRKQRTGAIEEPQSANTAAIDDPINPAHYKGDRVMQIIEDFNLDFTLGQVIKYVLRAGHKPGATESEDLLKAKWYLQRRLDRLP